MIKKYRVHDLVKYDYSEIKQYTGKGYTDTPLRNDEIVNLLNKQEKRIKELEEENRALQRHLDVMRSGALTDDKRIKELYNENEQLKNEVYDWKASAEDYLKLGQSLKKENEQLKKENELLKNWNKCLAEKRHNDGDGRMTEVQKPRHVKELLKYSGIDDYEIVVEINHEEHNLDFLVDGIRKKIIFFYDYGDGDDLDDCKKEIKKLKSDIIAIEKRADKVYDENKQLKKTNQGLYDELQETMGYLSLKTGVEKENKQLKKEKKTIQQENLSMIDFMNANFDEHMTQEKLNRRIIELTNENKELKKDLEYWKSNCLSYKNQNSILWNEISILQKQGAKTSASFEEYVDSISTEHTRYWKRKLNKAKKDGVIE